MERIIALIDNLAGERVWGVLRKRQSNIVGVVCSFQETHCWWRKNNIKRNATKLGIPVLSNKNRNEDKLLRLIIDTEATFLLSVQHPWVLSENVLAAVGMMAINVHTAPLPRYGGFNATIHAILEGSRVFGPTAHWMTSVVDSGPHIFRRWPEIRPDDTALSLYCKTINEIDLLADDLLEFIGSNPSLPALNPLAAPCRFLGKGDIPERRIKSIDDVDIYARAFYFPPFPPAFIETNGNRYRVVPWKG